MHIREETPADYDAIRGILIAAFADHPYSRQTEHRIVEGLREDGAVFLALVAEIQDEVVGHIAFSAAAIDGRYCGWMLLGPLAVLPSRQRQGIGKALVLIGLEFIKNLGARGCVLVGDPAYYRRFGFENVPGLQMEGVPPEVILAMSFEGDAPCGRVTYHPAFFIE